MISLKSSEPRPGAGCFRTKSPTVEVDTSIGRLLLSGSLSFSLAAANRFERFHRRVAQLVERCLDTAEVWGSSPHAPTKTLDNFWGTRQALIQTASLLAWVR